jgi:tryptophan synthase alpha chain
MNNPHAITCTFAHTRARHEAALIVYLTAGFPTLDRSLAFMEMCATRGADIIEVGIPFSDPVADGPSIQYASCQALEQGVTMSMILDALKDNAISAPIVIMSYLNPILAFGWTHFLETAVQSRISGLIIPDLPVEEAQERAKDTRECGIDLILLAAPTSTPGRLKAIINTTQGFLYCVSMTGTTGVRSSLNADARGFLQRVRSLTDISRVIGFGISTPEHVRSLCRDADGIVVGSRMIEAIRHNEDVPGFVHTLKQQTRR